MQYLTIGISVATFVYMVLRFNRDGRHQDREDEIRENTKIDSMTRSLIELNMKMDSVYKTTTETRQDIKALNDAFNAMDKRVSRIEMRLDALEERVAQ